MFQLQLRQAKLLSPRSPHVRLLERRYQSHLRHSRDDLLSVLSWIFLSCSEATRASSGRQCAFPICCCLRSFRLQLPGTLSFTSSSQHATQLPAPHTAQPPVPAHSLNQPLTLAEVEVGLQQLHNGRSGALHGYTSELLRYAKLEPTPEVPAPRSLAGALPCRAIQRCFRYRAGASVVEDFFLSSHL